jgi:hypothetical protein
MTVKKYEANESLKNRSAQEELNISSTGYGLESVKKPNKFTATTEDNENENVNLL